MVLPMKLHRSRVYEEEPVFDRIFPFRVKSVETSDEADVLSRRNKIESKGRKLRPNDEWITGCSSDEPRRRRCCGVHLRRAGRNTFLQDDAIGEISWLMAGRLPYSVSCSTGLPQGSNKRSRRGSNCLFQRGHEPLRGPTEDQRRRVGPIGPPGAYITFNIIFDLYSSYDIETHYRL
jgi:hypothetical protein